MTQHGGARPGAGRRRTTRRITRDAAVALRLLAWQRYGRPTSDAEEDALLSTLVLAALGPARQDGPNDRA